MSLRNGSRSARQSNRKVQGNQRLALQRACRAATPTVNPGLESLEDRRLFAFVPAVIHLSFDELAAGTPARGTTVTDTEAADNTAYPQSGTIQGASPAPTIVAGGKAYRQGADGGNFFNFPNTGNASQNKSDAGWIDLPDINKYLRTTSSLALWLRVTNGLVSPNGDFWNDPSVAGVEEAGAGDDVFWGHITESGQIGVGANGDGALTSFAVNDGQWRHFVFTRDQATGQVKTYVNGVLAATATTQAGVIGTPFRSLGASENRQVNGKADSPLSTTPFGGDPTLGINLGGPTYNFANSAADGMNGRQFMSGAMDEVEIFNVALTDQDVKDMYAKILPVTTVANVTADGSPYGVTVSWDSQPGAVAYRVYRTVWGDLATPPTDRADYISIPGDGQPFIVPGAAQGRVTFKDGGVNPNTNYYYRVVAVNGGGESSEDLPNAPLAQAGTRTAVVDRAGALQFDFGDPPGAGNSFWGRPNRNSPPLQINQVGYITRTFNGQPVQPTFSEYVSQVNFDWTNNNPVTGNNNVTDVPADNFSTVFVGRIKAPATGTYTFVANADDDTYFYVNGQLVAFDPQGHGFRDSSQSNSGGGEFTINLTKDQIVNFTAFQAEQGGGAGLRLRWIRPGAGRETIPTSAFVGTIPNGPSATGAATQTPADGRPAAPDNMHLVNNADLGADHYVLNWNDNATNEVRYVVQRRSFTDFTSPTSPADFEYELPTISNPNGAVAIGQLAEQGVNPGITYYYRVRAENLFGASDWSPSVAVTPQARPAKNPPPAAPSDVRTWSFTTQGQFGNKDGVFISFQDNSLFEQGNFGLSNPIIRFEIDRKDLTDATQNGNNGWISITGGRGYQVDGAYNQEFVNNGNNGTDTGEYTDAFPGGFADFPDLYGHPGTGRVLLFDSSTENGHLYQYRVRTHTEQYGDPDNFYINSTFSAESLPVLSGPVGGTGFHANYFDNIDFTGTRREFATALTHFNFGNGAPAGIGNDQYGGVLEGEFLAVTTEPYSFLTDSDDGVALRVIDPNGDPTKAIGTEGAQVLIDFNNLGARRGLNNGDNPNFQDLAGVANLVRNRRYLVQLRWVEDGGGAGYKVGYKTDIQTNGVQQFLPLDLVRPATSQTPVVAAGSITAVEQLGNEKFRITFRDTSASEDGYRLQRSMDNGTSWQDAQSIGSPILTANNDIDFIDDLGLAPDASKPAFGSTIMYRMITNGTSPLSLRTTAPVAFQVSNQTDATFRVNSDAAYQNNGTANTTTDDSIRVVRNVNNVTGTAYMNLGRDMIQAGQGTGGSNGFNLTFNFRAHDGSSSQQDPADGFAFVINRDRRSRVGGGGGGLGYTGTSPSVAIKFDTWSSPRNDPGGTNSTGVYVGGNMNDTEIAGTPDPVTHQVATAEVNRAVPTGLTFATDSKEYKVDLSYNADTKVLTETVTQVADPTKFVVVTYTNLDLKALMGGEYAWLGFSAGNGGLNEQVDINRFRVNGERIFGPEDVGPKVTGVFVKGAWAANFLNYLGTKGLGDPTLGYKVNSTAATPDVLPWISLNQVAVQFDTDVGSQFAAGNSKVQVKVRDSRNADAASADNAVAANFASYDAATKTAIYTLPTALTATSKVLVSIRDTDVTNNGAALDGDGNGTAGGNFNLRFNVIPGDARRDGTPDVIEAGQAKLRTGANAAADSPNYSIFFDVNGNGVVDVIDAGLIKQRAGAQNSIGAVPGEPTPIAAVFSSEEVSLVDQLQEGEVLA